MRKVYNNKRSIGGCLFLLSAFCFLLFVSCSQEEFLPQETDSDAIKISASIGALQTRVSYDTKGYTTFDKDDQIRVKNTLRTSKNIATYTLTDEGWNTADAFVWSSTSLNQFEAWYPVTDGTSFDTFTLPTEQNSSALLGAADWMTIGTKEIEKPSDKTLKLHFLHMLTKVTVNVTSWGSEYDGTDKTIEDVKIYSLATDIVQDREGLIGQIKTASLTPIAPLADGNSYTAIVCPGLYSSDQKFMTFTVNGTDNLTVLAKVSSPIEIEAAKHYTFNLTVGKDAAIISSVEVIPWAKKEIVGGVAEDVTLTIDLSKYTDGETVNIAGGCWVVGDGNEYNIKLNITDDAIVTFAAGTGGVKLTAPITVADGKTMTLLVTGDAEHTVNGGISLGNASNVIIEGDLSKENNKLTVNATDGNAGIGANGGVTAGDITIRNARVDATGSSKEVSADSNKGIKADTSISGAAIGTSDGSMGDILIENSIIVAEGGYYESTSHAPAIGIGYVGSTMGNITLKDSQITARNNGDGLASVIGAGANMHVDVTGTLGDIVITNTELNLSMEIGTTHHYAALIGSGVGKSYAYVNMGKIIFTDMKQEELDEVIPTWLPSDFNQYGAYALGIGYEGIVYKCGTFGGVWVSDGNGGTVKIDDDGGYYNPE